MASVMYAYFPERSLLKRVNVGLCAQTIEDELVEEIMVQGGSVGPIVTIEPRRRKFHKPVTITMPLPPKCRGGKDKKRGGFRGAQINGGDDDVVITQLSPALKRSSKKSDTTPRKSKGEGLSSV